MPAEVRSRSSVNNPTTATATRPQVTRYQDHFSLQAPTSIVRFGDCNSTARVIYNNATNSQLVIEERADSKGKRHITIKQMQEEPGGGLRFLRLLYSLVAAFFMGFLFVFSIQVLILVLFDLAVYLGYTDLDVETSYGVAIGVLFSIPILVHGFALMMMLMGFFVIDLWQGHYYFQKFVFPSCPQEVVEWMFLLWILIAPLLVIAAMLFAQQDDWWQVGTLYWFFSILVFFVLFILSVIFVEAKLYLQIVRDTNLIRDADTNTWLGSITACVAIRKRNTLSGYTKTSYASFGSPDTAFSSEESKQHMIEGTLQEDQRNLYTRWTQWSLLQGWLYTSLDTPKRIYSVDDVTGRRPYVTSITWGLEKLFCRPRGARSRYVSLVQGPFAITSGQILSALICSFLGVLLVYLMIAAALVYMGFQGAATFVALVVILLFTVPCWWTPFRQYYEFRKLQTLQQEYANQQQLQKEQETPAAGKEDAAAAKENDPSHDEEAPEKQAATTPEVEVTLPDAPKANKQLLRASSISWRGFDDSSNNEISSGVYHVREKYRITQPTKGFRVAIFILEMVFFLFWPTISLYTVENWQLATVFVAIDLLCMLRRYTNAEVLIAEVGNEFAPKEEEEEEEDDEDKDKDATNKWRNQARLSQVSGVISRGKVYQFWRLVFWIFALVLLLLLISSQSAVLENTNSNVATFVTDFEYKPLNSLHYTACDFTKNIKGNLPASMLDYSYFSIMAYRTDNATQEGLDAWYGPGVVQDGQSIVEEFRATEADKIPVYYKLFIVDEPNVGSHAIVVIRGSSNAWDWFTNAQLWGSAILLQMVRAFLPFGYMWDPILNNVNNLLTTLQSGTLERLSFYKSSTAFVEHLKASGNYSSVVLTGHSLGGGLAIISGAQTQTQAVGLSAPNAMISRGRFGITAENLEAYTFNIIPDRDIVPMIDDPSKNLQRIECNAPRNDLMGCHSHRRSLCDTLYACGSGNRAFVCECVTSYGMPEPTPKEGANRTFQEACGHTAGHDF